jgi:23S rRNA (uracil1939-C5)-methyltransferase
MSDGRRALARVGPWTVAVPDAVPGDLADVELREHRDGAYRGRMVSLVRPSPRRVAPLCPHFERCGGCQWQRLDGGAHADYKGALVRRALAAIGFGAVPVGIVPAAAAWRYRTAGTYVPAVDDGGPALGLHAAAGPLPVPIHTCLVQAPALAAAFEEMRQAWRALASRLEDAGMRALSCRQIRIRVGDASREVAVGLIHDGLLTQPARDAIVDVISTRVARVVEITGRPARSLPRAGGALSGLRWGRRGVVEAILDRWYHVPVFAPFPVTGRAAAGAITTAIEALALDDRTTLLEMDAGIGAYTLPAAAKARLVVGRTAAGHLDTAQHNAAWNHASNAVFVNRAAQTLRRILRAYEPIQRALVPVTQDAVPFEALHRAGVERLVLLASSPGRLAEVLGAAGADGYEIRAVTVIDTHPQTSRAELHAVLDARRGAWPGAAGERATSPVPRPR